MFRELNIQEKSRTWKECCLGGAICLCIVQAIFICLWPVFISAGLLHNFGMMIRLPTPSFSPSDIIFLRTMASVSAFLFLGPVLVLFPKRLWVSLFGLGPPWVTMAVVGFISPSFSGGLLARVENGSAFIAIGLSEWCVCIGLIYFMRRCGVFQMQVANELCLMSAHLRDDN